MGTLWEGERNFHNHSLSLASEQNVAMFCSVVKKANLFKTNQFISDQNRENIIRLQIINTRLQTEDHQMLYTSQSSPHSFSETLFYRCTILLPCITYIRQQWQREFNRIIKWVYKAFLSDIPDCRGHLWNCSQWIAGCCR